MPLYQTVLSEKVTANVLKVVWQYYKIISKYCFVNTAITSLNCSVKLQLNVGHFVIALTE